MEAKIVHKGTTNIPIPLLRRTDLREAKWTLISLIASAWEDEPWTLETLKSERRISTKRLMAILENLTTLGFISWKGDVGVSNVLVHMEAFDGREGGRG